MPAGSGAHVYRTRLTWRAGWVLVAFYLALFGGGVIAAVTQRADTDGRWIVAICASAVVAIVGCLSAARVATAGIFTDGAGIRIRNLFVTDRFLWEDIDRFELRDKGSYSRVCAVILRDGTVLHAIGIRAAEGWLRTDTGPAQELVDGLNAELRAARAT